jgi:hypothetical protein
MAVVIPIDRGKISPMKSGGDMSYAWFRSEYPFDEMCCGFDLLGHATHCGNPDHLLVHTLINTLSFGMQESCDLDQELRGAKLFANDYNSARQFLALDRWLTSKYAELRTLRERFEEFYVKN